MIAQQYGHVEYCGIQDIPGVNNSTITYKQGIIQYSHYESMICAFQGLNSYNFFGTTFRYDLCI
jgi:hypothetical protein